MLRTQPKKDIIFNMEKEKLELYSDYLICNSGLATATGLSAVLDGEISHDKITRFLSERDYTSKDLWKGAIILPSLRVWIRLFRFTLQVSI